MTQYIKATDVAKLCRKTLKDNFPGTKFSCRLNSGRCIDIEWTDGPSTAQVDAVTHQYAGEGFDGMTDMRYSNDNGTTEAGEAVSYLTSFVFTRRELSPEVNEALREELATAISEEFFIPLEEVLQDNRYWPVPQVIYRDTHSGRMGSLYEYVRRLAEARAEGVLGE